MPLSVKTAFRWHRWLGLAAGVLLLVIGTSGAVAVFKAEFDWLVTPALRAAHPTGARPSADAFAAALSAAYPRSVLTALELAPAAGFAHRASLVATDGTAREVFLDPATAAVRGERPISAGYFSSLHNFVRQFHVRLLMGAWGRVFVGVFGVVLALSCLTGLCLYRHWLAGLWRLRWRGLSATARARELHKWVGLWSLLFNVMIALTGAVLGLENLAARIGQHWLGRPLAEARPPRATTVGVPLPPAALVARAQAAFPDLHVTSLHLPRRAGEPALVRGDAGVLIARRQNHVALDPVSGAILAVADRRQATGWARVYLALDPLHFGYFGGYSVKALWLLLGLAPGLLAVTGFWLGWRRRAAPRPAPPRDGISPVLRLGIVSGAVATLAAAFAVAAHTHGWADPATLIEHAVAKPLALALVAFPVTGALAWAIARSTRAPRRLAVLSAACGAWYVGLVTLFQ
jgi:uncharacterized iron-regulated membrane protein